jgi:hypothetical protein
METKSQETLLELLSVEDAGVAGHLGWYLDESATLRHVYISEGERIAAQRSFREDEDATVTIAR